MCDASLLEGISGDQVAVSSLTGEGIDDLFLKIDAIIKENKKTVKLLIPYSEQGLVSNLYNEYTVENTDYTDDGVLVTTVLDARGLGLYDKYIIKGE